MKMQWIHVIATGLILAVGAGKAAAQDEADALRFSMLQPQGTARSIGIGSALGSVGGDFTSLSVNPAGIGIYRKSEFMFTPSLMLNGVKSTYTGNTGTEAGSHFSFSNVGVVWAKAERGRRYERSNWKTVSFGLGLNRLADFTRDYSYTGLNNTSSASEVFAADANNSNYNPTSNDFSSPGFLGYESYLIDRISPNGQYATFVDYTAGLRQFNTVKERGGISELAFSLGGNYKEKLMIGGTLGLPILRYTREKTFTENDNSGIDTNYFDNFVYEEKLKTSGLGVNLKLGFIFKPNDMFRIGAAIHTPTVYSLTDETEASIIANTENLKEQLFGIFGMPVTSVVADLRTYSYTVHTPWRAVVSATGMLGTLGFVTVDYEYVDYANARFRFSDNSADKLYQQYINDIIKTTYRGASNIRGGAEIRRDNLFFRGGLGFYGNPYQSNVYKDGRRMDFSLGLGYRVENIFLDLAFRHHRYKNNEQPYRLPYVGVIIPTANLRTAQNNVALTVGWKF